MKPTTILGKLKTAAGIDAGGTDIDDAGYIGGADGIRRTGYSFEFGTNELAHLDPIDYEPSQTFEGGQTFDYNVGGHEVYLLEYVFTQEAGNFSAWFRFNDNDDPEYDRLNIVDGTVTPDETEAGFASVDSNVFRADAGVIRFNSMTPGLGVRSAIQQRVKTGSGGSISSSGPRNFSVQERGDIDKITIGFETDSSDQADGKFALYGWDPIP